jgi:Tfp pilus assembly protein PilV
MNTGRTSQMLIEARRPGGLSLVEILVTVALLVVIILGLTAMFNQTRKAFTVGLANVDYQDAGRTAMDLITRELEQMAPSDYSTYNYYTSVGIPTNGLNFYTAVSYGFTNVPWSMLAGDTTNFSLEDLYFVTRYNRQWNAVGYRLLPSDTNYGGGTQFGVGTLYRFATNNVPLSTLANFGLQYNNFLTDPPFPPASFSRVVDGVVDFRIRTFDRNGLLIPTQIVRYINRTGFGAATVTNYTGNADLGPLIIFNQPTFDWVDANPATEFINTNIQYYLAATGDYQYVFLSNAVPAYVEVELGIMEAPALAQLQALTNSPAAYTNFLTSHAGQVHIFRQRVSIPAADPAAYP